MTTTKRSIFAFEQNTIEQIPEDQRHGNQKGLVAIWFGMNMTPLTVVTGAVATTVFGMSFSAAIVALIIGHVIGGIGMALHAAQGPQLGVPQMLQARGQFGSLGASLIVLIAIVMFIGFAASNLVVASHAASVVFPDVSSGFVLFVCTVLSLIIALYGYRLVRQVTALTSYLVGALVIVAFLGVLTHGNISELLSKGDSNAVGFFSTIALGVVWQLAYAPYVSDYSRYLPKNTGVSGAFWGSYIGCVVSSIALMVLGALIGLVSKNSDIMAGLNALLGNGVGTIVLFGFLIAAIAGSSVNAYSCVLCVLTFIETFVSGWKPRVRARLVGTVILHAIVLTIALAGANDFVKNYMNFLLVLLYVLIPWSAINLVDYYLLRKGEYFVSDFFAKNGGIYGRFNGVAFVVFVIGVVVQIPFLVTTFYTGPIATAMKFIDIAWLVGLVVSGGLYYFVAKKFSGIVSDSPMTQHQEQSVSETA